MLVRRIYYAAKPYLPWGLRMALRRIIARKIRTKYSKSWPIQEAASATPKGWEGWPEGRKFAFVITHDVEGIAGLEKCRQLADLEMQMGVRSCFNFVPEGSYVVPAELRGWLVENGFEVGVHDLQHDGKLFHSRPDFEKKATRINRYLDEWNAVGFRSGFMLRNLDWQHLLNVHYDSSTFDTDPFEFQPDGVTTIFPFWIPRPKQPGRSDPKPNETQEGYIELPYTLPQDSTLFLLLQETSPKVWIQKLDWIARHRGMALINIHPDYIAFNGNAGQREYPARYYCEFLQYLRQAYENQFWQVCPRILAAWFDQRRGENRASDKAAVAPAFPVNRQATCPRLSGKRAAVLLYSYYPADPRPRRAAEAMVEAGMGVDLFCLSESPTDATEENINGVKVFRCRMQRLRGSKFAYLYQYSRFLLSSFWFLTRKSLRRKYDVVHVHNMPDFLVFAALLSKLRGSRIILDLHDPMPELMVAIYNLKPDQWPVRILRRLERWSIGFSNLTLTPNIAFKKLFASRSTRNPEKIQIVMNSPHQELFDPTRFSSGPNADFAPEEFRVMHHGSIVHRHGIDLLVDAIALLRPTIPGIRLDIYGTATPFLDDVMRRASDLRVADIVEYHGAKSQKEIAAAIRKSHLGVVPNRRSNFTDNNFPTRLFEYLAMYRPVVAPNTQGIRDYFGEGQMLFFEPGDVADLARQILWVRQNPDKSRTIIENGIGIYRQHLWSQEKAHFVDLVSRQCAAAL